MTEVLVALALASGLLGAAGIGMVLGFVLAGRRGSPVAAPMFQRPAVRVASPPDPESEAIPKIDQEGRERLILTLMNGTGANRSEAEQEADRLLSQFNKLGSAAL